MSEQSTEPRPTLEAVAARAGVSRATVSRVVNGGDGVREPLVERVRQAVEELGYVPNQAARSLVTRRHDAVAVVIAEPETKVFADPFFALQLRGISKELTAHDSQLVLLLTEGRADHARVARYLAGGHVDGALVFSLHLDDPLPGLIHGVPTVYGGRPGWIDGSRGAVYVDCDNRGGAREAVRHLVGLGRRHIGHITGALDQTSAVDRLDGFRDVMVDADPKLIAEGDFTPGAVSAPCGNFSTVAPTWTRCSPPTTSRRSAPCVFCGSGGGGCPRTSPWSASTICCRSPSRPTHRSRRSGRT